jgi:hypothetical protein
MIMDQLNYLLGLDDPDSMLHHMHVVAAAAAGIGPLGLPLQGELGTSVYTMMVDEPDVENWIIRTIARAELEHRRRGETPQFVALNQSMWWVETEHFDPLARKLMHEGRLHEHPHVIDMSLVYGAARDGRRWRGRRRLSGERAGELDQVELLVGRPRAGEWYGMPAVPHLLRLVGVG